MHTTAIKFFEATIAGAAGEAGERNREAESETEMVRREPGAPGQGQSQSGKEGGGNQEAQDQAGGTTVRGRGQEVEE